MNLVLVANPEEDTPTVELTSFASTTGTPASSYELTETDGMYEATIPETLTGEWYIVAKNSAGEIFFAGYWYAGQVRCYDYTRTTTDLSVITEKLDAIRGPGDDTVEFEINDAAGNAIPHCSCWIATDSAGSNVITDVWETDENGKVYFLLDPGTYYLFRQKNGYELTSPQSFTYA